MGTVAKPVLERGATEGNLVGHVTIGVDVGQRVDPTAICVAETERRPRTESAKVDVHFLIRHLERLPLGTPYPAVGRRVAAVAAGVAERTGYPATLYLDATGVGTPVVDTLRAQGVRGTLVPVYFTYGDRRVVKEDGSISLGKAWLVSRLQALLQSGLLHLPQTPESAALAQELLDYEIKVDEDANDRYGAFRVGAHDDLVTALGLATQETPPPPMTVTKLEEPPAPVAEIDWRAQLSRLPGDRTWSG